MGASDDSTDHHGVTTWAVIVETDSTGGWDFRVLAEVQGSREQALAELLRQAKRYRRRNKPFYLYRHGDRYVVAGHSTPFVFRLWERIDFPE
jgi:hypothetical protein